MTPHDLKSFRTHVANCDLAVYADIGSLTVLSSDGSLRFPQEYLDALCACAADLFDAAPGDTGMQVDHIIFLSPTGSRFFVRDMSQPDEILCCICAAEIDCGHFLEAAQAALAGEGRAA
jgi:hypothetical protein